MKHFYSAKPGQQLYHYTTADGARAILESNTLRLSEFSMMNDKSEYVYAKSQFLDAYRNRDVWVEEVPRWTVAVALETHEPATVMMIGCLTENRDDVGLWDRYADGGRGCVIGLDALWLENRAGVCIRQVSYDPGYLRDFVNTGLMMLQKHFEENSNSSDELRELAAQFVLDLYAFKDPRFCSEIEVRISRLTVTDKDAPYGLRDIGGHRDDEATLPPLPVQQRKSPHGLVRSIYLPLSDEEVSSAIRSVGFGPHADADAESSVRCLAPTNCNISFWKSDAPLR